MIKPLLTSVIDFIYPPECLVCHVPTSSHGTFCHVCFLKLSFIQDPLCDQCGYPLSEKEIFTLCGACRLKLPGYRLRTALTYNDLSKDLILKLKYFDQMDLAKPLAIFLYQSMKNDWHEIDAFIPVPLHWRRLWKRRYNQATELAKALSVYIYQKKGIKIPVMTNLLRRVKHTDSQGTKSLLYRTRNMRGAFGIRNMLDIQGKKLALIDDVYTTGATLNACTKALLKGNPQKIYAFTVTRVIRGDTLFWNI